MAVHMLNKLTKLQSFRLVAERICFSNTAKAYHRKFHVSPVPLEKYFSEKHEWIDVTKGSKVGTVGITHYAQDKLGEIVFIQLPDIGQKLEAEGEAGVLESVKAASDIYSPVTGTVSEVNNAVMENAKLINESPYKNGWLFKVSITQESELANLMKEDAYSEYLKTCS